MIDDPPFIVHVYHVSTGPEALARKPGVKPVALFRRVMAYDPGQIDAALAAAVGDEPGLIAELRLAFLESAETHVAAIEAARDGEAWRAAAFRLRGLAASFGAVRLMALASEAGSARVGDPETIRKLTRAVARL